MRHMVLVIAALGLCACVLSAQAPAPAATPPANPLVSEVRQAYTRVADVLLRMAEKMPEEQYGFQPVPEIPHVRRDAGPHDRHADAHLCNSDRLWRTGGRSLHDGQGPVGGGHEDGDGGM